MRIKTIRRSSAFHVNRIAISLLLLILALLPSGCATVKEVPAQPSAILETEVKPDIPAPPQSNVILETEDFIVLPVYYGTDRNIAGGKSRSYGYVHSNTVDVGMCMVSIPKKHKPGLAESPSMWMSEDPAEHVVLQKVMPQKRENFFTSLRRQEKQEVLVFIHGFNSTFEDSVRRTAQIAFDLNFKGQAVTYSWPSKGDISPPGYVHDKDIIGASVNHLRDFLLDIVNESGASAVHIIAHSMGNVALIKALSLITSQSQNNPLFGEVMLIAPDMNVDEFKNAVFRQVAKRVTLYASSKDMALMISKEINGGLRRAGDTDDGIVILPEMDTIDVSNVDTSLVGHTYFGDNNSVISDIYQLLKGLSPFNRSLVPKTVRDMKYWIFQPLIK